MPQFNPTIQAIDRTSSPIRLLWEENEAKFDCCCGGFCCSEMDPEPYFPRAGFHGGGLGDVEGCITDFPDGSKEVYWYRTNPIWKYGGRWFEETNEYTGGYECNCNALWKIWIIRIPVDQITPEESNSEFSESISPSDSGLTEYRWYYVCLPPGETPPEVQWALKSFGGCNSTQYKISPVYRSNAPFACTLPSIINYNPYPSCGYPSSFPCNYSYYNYEATPYLRNCPNSPDISDSESLYWDGLTVDQSTFETFVNQKAFNWKCLPF